MRLLFNTSLLFIHTHYNMRTNKDYLHTGLTEHVRLLLDPLKFLTFLIKTRWQAYSLSDNVQSEHQ